MIDKSRVSDVAVQSLLNKMVLDMDINTDNSGWRVISPGSSPPPPCCVSLQRTGRRRGSLLSSYSSWRDVIAVSAAQQ